MPRRLAVGLLIMAAAAACAAMPADAAAQGAVHYELVLLHNQLNTGRSSGCTDSRIGINRAVEFHPSEYERRHAALREETQRRFKDSWGSPLTRIVSPGSGFVVASYQEGSGTCVRRKMEYYSGSNPPVVFTTLRQHQERCGSRCSDWRIELAWPDNFRPVSRPE
jgi:hypothetical protein